MTDIVEINALTHVTFHYDDGTTGTVYFSGDGAVQWSQNGDTLMHPSILDTMWRKLKRLGYL